MEIKVNLVSGEVLTFDLPIARPTEFLSKIRPADIFQRSVHQILGKMKTVSINPECVEWIDFDSDDMPSAAPFAKTMTIRQLSDAAFKSWLKVNKDVIQAAMEHEGAQNLLLAYGQAKFKSGRSLCFEIRAKMERIEDRVKMAQKLFDMPALFVYGETSGIMLLNTKNIAIWQVVPGLKKSTFFAVEGELTSIKKGA